MVGDNGRSFLIECERMWCHNFLLWEERLREVIKYKWVHAIKESMTIKLTRTKKESVKIKLDGGSSILAALMNGRGK